jgi:translation initiation factor 1
MGANFESQVNKGWTSDNKVKPKISSSAELRIPQKHQLHLAKEKRRGKVVSIVKPFYLEKKSLQALLKVLKKKLGTGGTIKDNTLEFQGELSSALRQYLEELEYRFK